MLRVGVAVMAVLSLSPMNPTRGAEPHEQLDVLREKVRSAELSRSQLEARCKRLDDELAAVDGEFGRVARLVRDLDATIAERQSRLQALERKRSRLQSVQRETRLALAGHIRGAYAISREDWAKLALNQQDPARAARMLAYYRSLNRSTASLVAKNVSEINAAAELRQQLALEAVGLDASRERSQKEKATLEKMRLAQRQLRDQLRREVKGKDLELIRLKQDEQRLQDIIQAIENADEKATGEAESPVPARVLGEIAGGTRCPVSGQITAAFGSPRMSGRWDGVLISAREGTPVCAVAGGRVAYSDWLRGYGLLTIIDHGGGVMSLYAFCQTLYRKVGEPVAARELIATVGTTGGQGQAELYFGVREQGRAVDPMRWAVGAR